MAEQFSQQANMQANFPISEVQLDNALSDVMRRVYGLMTLGLTLTGLVAWYVVQSETALNFIFSSNIVFMGLIFGQLGLVMAISAGIRRFSPTTAMALFLLYSALNGVVFSTIFLAYTASSIGYVFFITAGMFAAMSVLGFTTNVDMSKYRGFLMMGLIGFIIASIANFFFVSSALYWILTYFGVGLFLALTVYDTQKIKMMTASAMMQGGDTSTVISKIAVMGALSLYLDFVNLFLMLLRIFGKRR